MPTISFTITPAVPETSAPRVPMHATDVADDQLDVVQSASPSSPVAVISLGPNSEPVSVTLSSTDATLYGDAAIIMGAVQIAPFGRNIPISIETTGPILKIQ